MNLQKFLKKYNLLYIAKVYEFHKQYFKRPQSISIKKNTISEKRPGILAIFKLLS